ncbi:MAG: HAD family hydrolase [Candidatus Thorarchaeota archaeon]
MTEQLRCKAVIFDFDGTLADSMPFLEKIGVQIMMKYYGIEKDDATFRYRSTTGLPYEHQIELNFPNDDRNICAVEEFEHLKIERIFEQELFPSTESMLESVHAKGIKIFVSSSTFQPTIAKYFELRSLSHMFQEIVGYRAGFEKGPHHFRHIQYEHKISLADVVFIGDSLKDFERSIGFCRFIGIEGIFKAKDFIEKGHNGLVLSSIGEVPNHVIFG